MATGAGTSYFLIKLTVILLVWNYRNSVEGICRYGAGPYCAFPCGCATRCDEWTGECLDGGQCLQGRPSGFDWLGTPCRKGNVAYQKRAYQSGTWGGQIADYAVDGDTNPDVSQNHCAHPKASGGPLAWWYVDLGTVHRVEKVSLYNREGAGDGSYRRMSYFKITVGNNTPADSNPQCIEYRGSPVPSAGNINVTCTGYGRYVGYVRLGGGIDTDVANLCEVVVEGYKYVDCSGGNCQGSCDNLNGCSNCPIGTKYPDCKTECDSGYYGENCESRCSSYCKQSLACDRETGKCTGGCRDYTDSQDWYLGDRCDIKVPKMAFGSSDIVNTVPVNTTTNSVTWTWTEGVASNISPGAARYIGYYIYYRRGVVNEWSKTPGISYVYSTEGTQKGTVTGLQAGARYEFDISVYRRYVDETIHENNYRASASPLGNRYLDATTQEGGGNPPTSQPLTPSPATAPSPTPSPATAPSPPPSPATAPSPPPSSAPAPPTGPMTNSTPTPPAPSSTPPDFAPGPTTSGSGQDTQPVTKPNGGVIGGAVVAALVVTAAVVVLVFFLLRRRKKNDEGKPRLARPDIVKADDGRSIISESSGIGNPGFVSPDDKSVHSSLDNIYQNTPAIGAAIPVDGLRAFIEMKKNQRDGFKQEFQKIPSGELRECNAGSTSENKNKNRFGNIKAYDATRVVLDVADPTREGDYVNANYITGYKDTEKIYVATQAPKPHTITDLWRMIWQLNANRIVMVTQIVETGRRKSEYYWNEQINAAQTHGDYSITTVSCETFTDYAIRIFNITKGDETRKVRHLQFLLWPDKLAPEHSFPLLSFRRKVRSFDSVSTGPMIVHCSAGVGRTGTFIALDYLLEQAAAENKVGVVKMVSHLRQERMTMIQTLPQYTFVYESLLEAITCGETAIPCSRFQEKLDLLMAEDENGSPLDKQFQLLGSMKPHTASDKLAGLKAENTNKNRVNDIVPGDNQRPFLSTKYEGGNDYINAVMVDSYKKGNANIATQMPLSNTVVDFWRLVYDHKCETIVMLNSLDKNDETCSAYWPDDDEPKEKYGPLEVRIEKSDQAETVTMREFQVSNIRKTNEEPHVVRQFQVTRWPNDAGLPPKDTFLDLLDAVETWQKQGNTGPLIVHCMDGAARCGLFCAASYMIDKMKVDQEVDAFLAVRYTSIKRPEFVSTLEQYRFLHELAKRCMARYDVNTYANL